MPRPKKTNKPTFAELIEQHRRLEREIAEARAEALVSLLDQIKELVEINGFTMKEVAQRMVRGAKRPKGDAGGFRHYRDPDTGATWKRTGRMPKWLAEKIKQGHSISEFEI